MSEFVYIVAEGVQDVAFLGRLLVLFHQAQRVRRLEDLREPHRTWMGSFTWPIRGRNGTEIDRLAVPAPTFYALPSGGTVVLRCAEGLDKIRNVLVLDREAFDRTGTHPDTIGVVLDSDDKDAAERMAALAKVLTDEGLPAPDQLAVVREGKPRIGAFVLPEPGVPGTLEDLLLQIADRSYPTLAASARGFADHWRQQAAGLTGADWKAIKKPAGARKAAVAAVTAILRPGYAAQMAIEQSEWIRPDSNALPALARCLGFFDALLMTTPPTTPPAPTTATPGDQATSVPERAP